MRHGSESKKILTGDFEKKHGVRTCGTAGRLPKDGGVGTCPTFFVLLLVDTGKCDGMIHFACF